MSPPVTATALIAAMRAVAVAEGTPGNEPARALDALERLPRQGMLTLHQAVDMPADDRGYMPGVAQSAVRRATGCQRGVGVGGHLRPPRPTTPL